MSQRLLHCDLSKWIINQKGRFVREGTSVSYKRYNMTGAGLRCGRVETVGVLCSGASSFAAPLKVNKELSNGPVMLIKKEERKKKNDCRSPPISPEPLFRFWVSLSLVYGLLGRAPIPLCQCFTGWLMQAKAIIRHGQYDLLFSRVERRTHCVHKAKHSGIQDWRGGVSCSKSSRH